MTIFTNTASRVAAQADATTQYVTKLARSGRLPFVQLTNGIRLFSDDAPATVRRLKAESIARRGQRLAA